MGNWAEQVYAPVEQYNYNVVIQNTWGHLAPNKNTTYRGEILFCKSAYRSGSIILIDTKCDELDDSPWIYEAYHEYLNSIDNGLEYGTVYKLSFTMRNFRFWGKITDKYQLTKTNP